MSLVMYGTFAVGSWIWLAYGVALGDVPIIVSFAVGVIGTTLVIILALRYR